MSQTETQQVVSASQYEAALQTVLHFKEVVVQMRDNEARQANIRKEITKIASPILAKARVLTADLRAKVTQIQAEIKEKETPLREEAATATSAQRKEGSDLREQMKTLKAALYGAVE